MHSKWSWPGAGRRIMIRNSIGLLRDVLSQHIKHPFKTLFGNFTHEYWSKFVSVSISSGKGISSQGFVLAFLSESGAEISETFDSNMASVAYHFLFGIWHADNEIKVVIMSWNC